MNTNDTTSRLPQVFSQINPTFASKADYLGFVQQWKAVYRYLSLTIRATRLRSRLQPNNRAEKKAALEKELASVSASLVANGPCPYMDHGRSYGSHQVALGAAAATWLLELRAAAKIEAGKHRAVILATRKKEASSDGLR